MPQTLPERTHLSIEIQVALSTDLDLKKKRASSTYPGVLACLAVEERIRVPLLLRFSSASESRRTVCPEQGCGAATSVRLLFPLR